MQLSDIQLIFNRAIHFTFGRTKLILTFCVLALCGLFSVFARGLATHTDLWMTISLTFFPFFLCSGIFLALGVILIRGYHDEIKKKSVNYSNILSNSWETMLGAAYFTVPFILIYLMLWMLLGIFILLQTIPVIGNFFAVILAFAPFLLNLCTLLLCLSVIVMLFYVTPVIAFKGLNRSLITQTLVRRFQSDIFYNLLLFIIGLLPLALYVGLLISAALLSGSICTLCNDPLEASLQWFFLMIPFAALLAPAVVFFFNFAAEAHVIAVKKPAS